MEAIFEVFISDTIHGPRKMRRYSTRVRAEKRYSDLKRDHRPDGHSTVILRSVEGGKTTQVYPEPIITA